MQRVATGIVKAQGRAGERRKQSLMSLPARGSGISQQHKATRLAKGVAIACHCVLPPCFGPATSLHCPSSVSQRDGICSPLHAPSPARRQTSSPSPAPCLPSYYVLDSISTFVPLYLYTFLLC